MANCKALAGLAVKGLINSHCVCVFVITDKCNMLMHLVVSHCIYLSVCTVWVITFESLDIETTLLLCRYICRIYQGQQVKVTGAKRSNQCNYTFVGVQPLIESSLVLEVYE